MNSLFSIVISKYAAVMLYTETMYVIIRNIIIYLHYYYYTRTALCVRNRQI